MPAGDAMMRRVLLLRVAARAIDTLLVTAPLALGGYLLNMTSGQRDAGLESLGDWLLFAAVSAAWLLVVWPLYEAISYRRGGTVGMRLVGLRMLRVDGTIPPLAIALTRGALVVWPILVGLFAYALPAIAYAAWLIWDASQDLAGRHWIDRTTGSIVLPADATLFDLTR
jgi:uncharacterized RDD family membrane protein YckC